MAVGRRIVRFESAQQQQLGTANKLFKKLSFDPM